MNLKSLTICIGRFQPVHLGHIDLIHQSLKISDATLIVIGSANQPLTPQNPFTWEEREEMLRRALPANLLAQVDFVALPDNGDTKRWAQQLSDSVQAFIQRTEIQVDRVTLLGDFSDPSVKNHPFISTWKLIPRKRFGEYNSTRIRDWIFSLSNTHASTSLGAIGSEHQPVDWLHESTVTFIAEWKKQPIFEVLSNQWQNLHRE